MRGPLRYPVELSTHGDGCRGCTDARARKPSESISITFCCVSRRSRPPDKWRLAAPRRRSAPRARPAPLLHGCPELELLVGHERSWSGVKVTASRRWPTGSSRALRESCGEPARFLRRKTSAANRGRTERNISERPQRRHTDHKYPQVEVCIPKSFHGRRTRTSGV